MDCFACAACGAAVESVAEGSAVLSIVRHAAGCAVLAAQVRARYAQAPTELPAAPRPKPFAQRAAFGRFHDAVKSRQKRQHADAERGRARA